MEKLVIKIKYGGLGDHLFYSHIPKIAKESKRYSSVHISNKSDFRNPHYKKIIWELNPYVDGFSDEDGQCVDSITIEDTAKENILDKIMLGLNLDDGQRFHEPEMYYVPHTIPDLYHKTIYDPNYVSNAGLGVWNGIETYFNSNNITIDYQCAIRKPHSSPIYNFNSFIKNETLEDFLDIIYSAKEIYCLASGTATLAAALKKPAHIFYTKNMNPIFLHSKNNTYIKI